MPARTRSRPVETELELVGWPIVSVCGGVSSSTEPSGVVSVVSVSVVSVVSVVVVEVVSSDVVVEVVSSVVVEVVSSVVVEVVSSVVVDVVSSDVVVVVVSYVTQCETSAFSPAASRYSLSVVSPSAMRIPLAVVEPLTQNCVPSSRTMSLSSSPDSSLVTHPSGQCSVTANAAPAKGTANSAPMISS